jgi:hypothetical protein
MSSGSSHGANLDWVASRVRNGRYASERISDRVATLPGMISMEERRLLSFVTANAWDPATSIIDGGCFLGASTGALAEGLRHNKEFHGQRGVIHSYDLFQADAYMADVYLKDAGIEVGGSFQDLFLANIEADRDLVTVHPGDVRTHEWNGSPIGILFLDMLWSWDVNAFAMKHFYRHLAEPGSLVVHQDYVYAWYPWLPITMEYFSEHFEFIGYVPLATVVFRCRKPLSAEEAAIDMLRDNTPETLLSLMDRVVERFSGWQRGVLECSRASLLRYLDRNDQARDALHAVLDRYRDDEAPVRFARQILLLVDAGAPTRLP